MSDINLSQLTVRELLPQLQAGELTSRALTEACLARTEELNPTVKAFVAVNIDRQNTDLAQDFRRRVREHPQVQACHMISGTIDFMLEVVAKDLDAFGNFIDGELLSMPAVKDASSSIVLKVVKRNETMIE